MTKSYVSHATVERNSYLQSQLNMNFSSDYKTNLKTWTQNPYLPLKEFIKLPAREAGFDAAGAGAGAGCLTG